MNSRILRKISCIFFGIFWVGAVGAQSSEEENLALVYGDQFTTSLATGSRQSVSKAPAAATVITAQDIQAMGATDLDQVMESVPGVHVSMQHVAMNPIYSFRGIHTKENPQVLMLVNGLPITNVFVGDRSQLWGGMPLENVERIEVIRGPGSALYGADAFSGVVNIITKTSANIQGTEAGLRKGSFNATDAWAQYGGTLGELDSAFYLRAGNTDGSQANIHDVLGASGPLSTSRKAIDARADLSKEAWRLRAGYQQRELGVGAGLAGALDANSRGNVKKFNLDMSYDQTNWAPNWDVSGVAGYYNIREHGEPYYTLFPGMLGNPAHSEQHTHASASAFYTGFDKHRIRIGSGVQVDDLYSVRESKNYKFVLVAGVPTLQPIAWQDVSGTSLAYLLPHKRNVIYAYAQDEWSIANDWALTAGVRHDRYSDFGSTTNPRLALVWDAAYNVVVKAMHGTAFRAPAFTEMYNTTNPVGTGNSSIKPETITTDELAFSWQQTSKLRSNLNLFRYHMSNIIIPDLTPTHVYQNEGDQTGRGLELEATYDATSNLRYSGNYSLQHSIDSKTGKDAGLAPRRHLFARVDWRFAPQWQFGTTLNHVADRMREPNDTLHPNKIPDYTTVDMNLRCENFVEGWDARVMITNLFNRNALEPTFLSSGITSDLPLPGRALYVQLQYWL
ncbi:MAG: TonB-dependent receptor [Sideroxydans sp.]|nr:TonB-dependent receptor [Sideroxydans sp.]